MNIPAVDTLCALIDIKDYESSTNELLQYLQTKKDEAKLVAASNASEKVIIDIGCLSFEILPNGSKGHAFILHNSLYEVKLAQYRPKKEDFYPVFIRIKSECLWNKGAEDSWRFIISWVNDNLGEVVSNKINRLDTCCHTDEIILSEDDLKNFKGNFKNDEVFRENRKVSGLGFGSRKSKNIYCRIYNKFIEVRDKSKKFWFYDIWNNKDLDIEKVWNVEFEIKRDFFKEHNIESVEDALQRLKDIWEFCTSEWIVLVDGKRTRRERCEINYIWENIQKSFNNFESKGLITREKQLSADADALVPSTIGYITTFAARKGLTDMHRVFEMLFFKGNNYLQAKNNTFKQAISDKMTLIKTQGG